MFFSKYLLFYVIFVIEENSDLSSANNSNYLKIGTVLQEPYVFRNNDSEEHIGFMVDLIDLLKSRLHFDYSFEVFDKYGTYSQEDNSWDGLIGELIKNQNSPHSGISLAAAALSVTAEREAVVDFVKPLQHIGNSFLMRKRSLGNEASYHVAIFNSFSVAVWACILVACVVTSVLIWLMNTFNPYDYGCRYSIGLAEKDEAELFNLKSSLWFCFSIMLWQGYERSPRSIGSKIMAGSWMTFMTVIICFFVASLTSFMMFTNFVPIAPEYPRVNDLYHLITSHQGFKIGTIRNSQTYQQLTSSNKSEALFLKKYWSGEGADYLVDDLTNGLRRLSDEGDLVLIVDTLTAKYWASKRPCNLAVIGSATGRQRAIGLALPIGSLNIEVFHEAVLRLVEEGEVERLENLWFFGANECWNESRAIIESQEQASVYVSKLPAQTDVTSFWGAFVFMIVGLLTCCVVALVEIIKPRLQLALSTRKISRHGQSPWSSEVSEDGFM